MRTFVFLYPILRTETAWLSASQIKNISSMGKLALLLMFINEIPPCYLGLNRGGEGVVHECTP